MTYEKPRTKPSNPNFSSGPSSKRPNWSVNNLTHVLAGRSHRSDVCKKQLAEVIDRHRALLNIPTNYRIAIVPASDTGAVEMALWSLLGERGVDVFAWEGFSAMWMQDITEQLKLPDVRCFSANYGDIADLGQAAPDRDIVFAWNGTTSGVRVPHADWISDKRTGLTICDATSAVFAYDMPWDKLDVTTWSWQKVLGGEAAHGMIVLSPRAAERLETYQPAWPLPKIFQMSENSKIKEDLFLGSTINTPSMLAVADCIDALNWVEKNGGLSVMKKRCQDNFDLVEKWVSNTDWVDFLAHDQATRSVTSVCLKIVDPWFVEQEETMRQAIIKSMTRLLETEQAANDIASYRDAPAGLRLWCGAMVETQDIEKLLPWLTYAYQETKTASHKQAA